MSNLREITRWERETGGDIQKETALYRFMAIECEKHTS
jgi:hypothetical protein